MKATEINDLIIDSEERGLLWTALKERGMRAEANYEAGRGMQVDFALLCALGNLGIVFGETKELKETGEWKYLAVPDSAVKDDLPGVMRKIEDEVAKLGGPAM